MKRFSHEELEKSSEDFLKGKGEVHATTDGQFFYDKVRADLHAEKRRLTVYTFPSEKKEKGGEAGLTVKDLVAKIADITDKAELENELETEKASANRISAIKAIEERISKISA